MCSSPLGPPVSAQGYGGKSLSVAGNCRTPGGPIRVPAGDRCADPACGPMCSSPSGLLARIGLRWTPLTLRVAGDRGCRQLCVGGSCVALGFPLAPPSFDPFVAKTHLPSFVASVRWQLRAPGPRAWPRLAPIVTLPRARPSDFPLPKYGNSEGENPPHTPTHTGRPRGAGAQALPLPPPGPTASS